MESINIEGTNEDLENFKKLMEMGYLCMPEEAQVSKIYFLLIIKHIDEQLARPLPF